MNGWLIIEFVAVGFIALLVSLLFLGMAIMLLHTPLEHLYDSYQKHGPRAMILKALQVSAVLVVIFLVCIGSGWAVFEYTTATPKATNQTVIEFLVVQ